MPKLLEVNTYCRNLTMRYLLCYFLIFICLFEVSAQSLNKNALSPLPDDNTRLTNIADVAKSIAKLVGAEKMTLRFSELSGRGPNSTKWQGNLAAIKSELKNQLSKFPHLEISDLENLKSIEENAAIDGRNVRLKAADYNVKITVRQMELKLIVEVSVIHVSNGIDTTLLFDANPRDFGINLEADIPPVDAAVKISDKVMMDVAEKLARNIHLKSLPEMQTQETDADQSFAKAINKNIQSNDEQIQRFSQQVVEEVSQLMGLDKNVVRQSFEDRQDFLLIEGKLQNIDTSRQRLLLGEVLKIWEKSIETGIKPSTDTVINACLTIVKTGN